MAKAQSVGLNIADLANGWLKFYHLDYKLEQELLRMKEDIKKEKEISQKKA